MASKSKVLAVCISEKKGIVKHAVDFVEVNDKGIVGDAHSGDWHRQVSLLGIDSVNKMQSKISVELKPGAFAENILIDTGILLYELQIGQKVKVGECILEVTQIGKECHATCEIRKVTGDCVMPREGIFTKVITGGKIKAGDEVELLS